MSENNQTSSRHDIVVGLRGLSENNRLWRGLLGHLEAQLEIEQEAICAPNVADSEVHRARGRMGILLELRADLVQLHAEAHTTQ